MTNQELIDIANGIWARPVEGQYTAEQILRLMAAVLLGKVSGAGSGLEKFAGLGDADIERVASHVDNMGNRLVVTLDATPDDGIPDPVYHPTTAATVPYSTQYPTVADALDALLYVAPSATLTLSVGSVEIGQVVDTLVANWTFNKTMTAASLTGATITPSDNTYTYTALGLTSNRTYTLTFGDGTNSGSVSRAVSFLPKRYWGVSPDATLSNSDILALSQELSSSKGKSITYDCSGGNYFYWCYPASLGLPSGVTVGGLAFSDYTVTVQSLTNASGYTQDYNVVRCNSLQTGAAINVVWS